MYKNPSPCVSILIIDNNRILLGKRGDSEIKPGKWCLPCGYMERKENCIQAAVREVKEETNLEIKLKNIVNVVSNHYPGKEHSLVIVLTAEPVSTDLKAGDDIVDVKWYSFDQDLPEMAFKADVHIMEQYWKYGEDFGIPLEKTIVDFTENIE